MRTTSYYLLFTAYYLQLTTYYYCLLLLGRQPVRTTSYSLYYYSHYYLLFTTYYLLLPTTTTRSTACKTQLFGSSLLACSPTPEGRETREPLPLSRPHCHTAGVFDPNPLHCWSHVYWAQSIGVKQYPDWFPGLTASSSFMAFQDFLVSQAGNALLPDEAARPSLSCRRKKLSS